MFTKTNMQSVPLVEPLYVSGAERSRVRRENSATIPIFFSHKGTKDTKKYTFAEIPLCALCLCVKQLKTSLALPINAEHFER